MGTFVYKQMTQEGAIVQGVLETQSLQEAKALLLEKGGIVLELKEKKGAKLALLSFKERLDFTHQMHLLLSAGLPIYESLLSLEEKKVRYAPLLKQLSTKIKQGESLSSALRQFPESFNPFYIAVIQAAEISGEINEGFFSLQKLQERQALLMKVVKGAVIYPAILMGFSLIIVYALLFFIIPSLRELFEGKSVNGLTSFILFLSDFCIRYQMMLAFGGMIFLGALAYFWKRGHLKKKFFAFFEKLPFFKTLIFSLKLQNFFSCTALLLARGINLKDALIFSKNVLHHPSLEKVLDGVVLEVLKGKRLSEVLKEPFPAVARRLVGLAEVTGKMAYAMEQLASIYEEESREKIALLTSFLQPILLALIGMIIGGVVLSILIPLTDVGGFI